MARPRKYVRVNGRVIDGVSFHKATNRCDIYDVRGKSLFPHAGGSKRCIPSLAARPESHRLGKGGLRGSPRSVPEA